MRAAALCLTALALAGCNGDDEPSTRATKDARLAGDTVQQLERAIARRQFTTVCTRLFTRALRRRLGDDGCPRVLRQSARGLKRPRIRVEAVSLQGSRAEVRVLTTSERQQPARDVIVLLRERGRYRVDGLTG